MKRSMMTLSAAAAMVLTAGSVAAFTPDLALKSSRRRIATSTHLYSAMSLPQDPKDHLPYFASREAPTSADVTAPTPVLQAEVATPTSTMTSETTASTAAKAVPRKKSVPASEHHKQGVLSPVVLLAKQALGDDRLNKVRAKVISMHSDVISAFVDTSNSAVGQTVLKSLFTAADANGNGVLEEEELRQVFQTLGFDWLQDKQVKGILKRADADGNGAIDLTEFLQEAPKTLRTNLIKLAKKNGGDMGLLA